MWVSYSYFPVFACCWLLGLLACAAAGAVLWLPFGLAGWSWEPFVVGGGWVGAIAGMGLYVILVRDGHFELPEPSPGDFPPRLILTFQAFAQVALTAIVASAIRGTLPR